MKVTVVDTKPNLDLTDSVQNREEIYQIQDAGNVVQESLKMVILNMNQSELLPASQNKAKRTQKSFGKISPITLSANSLPAADGFSFDKSMSLSLPWLIDENHPQEEIKIKMEDINITGFEEPDLTEQEIIGHSNFELSEPNNLNHSNDILGLPSEVNSISDAAMDCVPSYPIKMELDSTDTFSFTTPLVDAFIESVRQGSQEMFPSTQTICKTYVAETFANSNSHNRNRNVEKLKSQPQYAKKPPFKRRQNRKCLVCGKSFYSGDTLATHLYTHIYMNNNLGGESAICSSSCSSTLAWNDRLEQKTNKKQRQKSSNESRQENHTSVIEENINLLSLINNSITIMKTSPEPQIKNEVKILLGFSSNDEGRKVYPTSKVKKENVASVIATTLPLPYAKPEKQTRKNRISISTSAVVKSDGVNVSYQKKTCGQSKLTKIAKSKPAVSKVDLGAARDALNCSLGFGDVIQKLVSNGVFKKKVK